MKRTLLIIFLAAFSLIALPSCQKDGPGEEMGKKIDDALDQRPHERVKDAVEELTKDNNANK